PHQESFDKDLQWDAALGLVRRLQSLAASRGLTFGAKFSNTLVVENHKAFFPASEKVMYLSGAPLHVITFELCRRFREAYGGSLPISFSAGVDAKNFPDCVAAGMTPVTTCTDLLKPGGYARLPKYLDQLAARMKAVDATTVEQFILAEAKRPDGDVHAASLQNHRAAAARAVEDKRYALS